MENDNLNNGHIIEIKPNMFEKVADNFSEGNNAQYKLITQ